jgi:hypothetical protein
MTTLFDTLSRGLHEVEEFLRNSEEHQVVHAVPDSEENEVGKSCEIVALNQRPQKRRK